MVSTPERLEVRPMPVRQEQGEKILSAELHLPTGERRLLWFAVDAAQPVTKLADPFLLGALFMGLENGWAIHVHGKVSAVLLHHLHEFQAIWQAQEPKLYRAAPLTANELVQVETPALACISTYSGGADSSFTAMNHAPDKKTPYPLQAGLMVHGFDIPLDDPAFASALQRARASLASLGLECIAMRTNCREIHPKPWFHAYGPALAACLHVLTPRFGTALIPSSSAYHEPSVPSGSSPLTDPLLGSCGLRIVHDGARFARRDKLAALAAWPEGLNALRVCWQGQERDRNCCRCEKCIRNMLNFRLLGMDIPASFPEPLSPKAISRLRFGASEINIWRYLIRMGEGGRLPPDILQAMRRITRRMQLRQYRQRLKRQIQQSLGLGKRP